jgi:crotonobetainyl-CoA:carnitine CoA-transferase CaiB-like acyl-CoA transferase
MMDDRGGGCELPEVPAPLAGFRVIDASTWVAGPWCAQLLSWLGAQVTKVDPPGGDPLAELDDGPDSTGRCLDDEANRGKQRVTAGSDARYVRLVSELAAAADVLVCDWTPRRQERLGLTLDGLRERYPRLVVVCVTPYGVTGPDADRPGCELTVYHAGGEGATLPSENISRHFPDRPPVRAGVFLADHDTGLTAALAAVAALVGRQRSGEGELVDVAGSEVEAGLNRTTLSRAIAEGRDFDRSYRGYDYAGALRCLDGWVAVRPVEERQWTGLCDEIGRSDLVADARFVNRLRRYDNADDLTTELEAWTSVHTRAHVRAALLRAGCPGGPFLSPGDVIHDAAIGSRELFAPIVGTESGGVAAFRGWHSTPACGSGTRIWPALDANALPLTGLRVVDLTWVAAGPYATELLAFLGAEVIRVESPSRPDIFRRSQDSPDADLDSSVRFMDLNQAKKSVVLDLKNPNDLERLLALAERANVVAENFRPGVRDRLGLGDAVLQARNASLVILALSGFGTAASDAERPGYASVFNAEGGLGWMTGYPDAPPSDVRDTNDLRGGTLGALAVVSALLQVARGEPGSMVDVATRDALVLLQGHLALRASRGIDPSRSANTLDGCVPYDCYRAEDGRWVAIGVRTEAEWSAFSKATGIAGASERRQRVAERASVDRAVDDWVGRRSAAEVIETLCSAGVPSGLSARASDLTRDRQLRARGALARVQHPRLGSLTLVQAPFVLGAARLPYARPPLLGEHGSEFFHDESGVQL